MHCLLPAEFDLVWFFRSVGFIMSAVHLYLLLLEAAYCLSQAFWRKFVELRYYSHKHIMVGQLHCEKALAEFRGPEPLVFFPITHRPDITALVECGWLGIKHQLTYLPITHWMMIQTTGGLNLWCLSISDDSEVQLIVAVCLANKD